MCIAGQIICAFAGVLATIWFFFEFRIVRRLQILFLELKRTIYKIRKKYEKYEK